MNTADDLLRRALEALESVRITDLMQAGWDELPAKIRAYLDAPKDDYDLSQVIPLTHRKTKGIIQDKNFYITGFVLTQEDGDKCIVDMSAVRWLSMSEFHDLMHPLIESPTKSAPKDEPVAWGVFEDDQIHDVMFSEEYAVEQAGFKGDHAVVKPLYLHPPTKTAPMKMNEEINKKIKELLGYGYSFVAIAIELGGAVGSDKHNELINYLINHYDISAAPMKPMTEEEAIELCPFTREEFKAGFLTGVRFAERHHGITDVRD